MERDFEPMAGFLDGLLGDLAAYRCARGGYWEAQSEVWFFDHRGAAVYKSVIWTRHALPGAAIKAELWS